MTSNPPLLDLPAYVSKFKTKDLAEQRSKWLPKIWEPVFVGHEPLFEKLHAGATANKGITRQFVHALAAGDPVELFLAAMAWGFGDRGYGPGRTADILAQPNAVTKIGKIIKTTRTQGALDGWDALLLHYKVPGLGMAFGTKLLYFAGYYSDCPGPRPLILDALVRRSLQAFDVWTVKPGSTIWRGDYGKYLELAKAWAENPSWNQQPDLVELALFEQARGNTAPDPEDDDEYAKSGDK